MTKNNRIVNGVTSSPLTLFILRPINAIAYNYYKLIWVLLSFIAFGCTVFFTFGSIIKIAKSLKYVLPIIALFLSSSIWLIHLERGQIYIFYTLLLAALYFVYKKNNNYSPFLLGLLLAFAIFIRPTFLFLSLPLLFFKNLKAFCSSVAALFLLFIVQYKLWPVYSSYINAMRYYTGEKNMELLNNAIYEKPTIIENCNNLTKIKDDFYSGGIEPLFNKLQAYNIPFIGLLSLVIVALVIIGLLAYQQKRKNALNVKETSIGLLFFICYIIPELLMASPRGAYNLVVYVFPALILFKEYQSISTNKIILLIVGWLFMQAIPFYFSINYPLGEFMLLAVFVWTWLYSKTKVEGLHRLME